MPEGTIQEAPVPVVPKNGRLICRFTKGQVVVHTICCALLFLIGLECVMSSPGPSWLTLACAECPTLTMSAVELAVGNRTCQICKTYDRGTCVEKLYEACYNIVLFQKQSRAAEICTVCRSNDSGEGGEFLTKEEAAAYIRLHLNRTSSIFSWSSAMHLCYQYDAQFYADNLALRYWGYGCMVAAVLLPCCSFLPKRNSIREGSNETPA